MPRSPRAPIRMTEFSTAVIKLVKKIPRGKVATYGQIARLAGKPHGARGVGWILNACAEPYRLPWQRVLNSKGSISFSTRTEEFKKQKRLLEAEGIEFVTKTSLDLETYQWKKDVPKKKGSARTPSMFRSVVGFLTLSMFLMGFSHQAHAQEADLPIRFAPEISTVFPIFLGVGGKAVLSDRFEFGIAYGVTPEPYYSAIGQVASDLGGNSSYKEVVQAAFRDNSLWKATIRYHFSGAAAGWQVGLGVSQLKASGRAGVDKVLAASTGKDYSQLKNLLVASGRSPDVEMDSSLVIGELELGYGWQFANRLSLSASMGVARVLTSDVKLKTGLSNFESTVVGNNLMRTSENDLESILSQYGLTPTVGVALSYFF